MTTGPTVDVIERRAKTLTFLEWGILKKLGNVLTRKCLSKTDVQAHAHLLMQLIPYFVA